MFPHKGDVVVVFERAYEDLYLPPAEAREVARVLLEQADALDPPAAGADTGRAH